MRPLPVAAGLMAILVAASLPGTAYHVQDSPSSSGDGLEPLEWSGQAGLRHPADDPFVNYGFPCSMLADLPFVDALCQDDPRWEAGDHVVGVTTCEAVPEMGAPGRSGVGGLCFMSPGFVDVGGVCTFDFSNMGRSNGRYDPYLWPPTACHAAPASTLIRDVARHWYEIRMYTTAWAIPGTDVAFTAEIGGFGCGAAGDSLVYDEQFAQTVADGHVTGYPVAFPPPGQFGTYKVSSAAPPSSPCGPLPMAIW